MNLYKCSKEQHVSRLTNKPSPACHPVHVRCVLNLFARSQVGALGMFDFVRKMWMWVETAITKVPTVSSSAFGFHGKQTNRTSRQRNMYLPHLCMSTESRGSVCVRRDMRFV